jgi:predicted DNA-binding transcriptional regulator AlpA
VPQPKAKGGAEAPPDLMTIDEFCAWARISRAQFHRFRHAGRGPAEIALGRRSVRILRSEALAWAAKMSAKPPMKVKPPAA